ncbi:MAG: rRNA pseudouridine synthase [Chitinivibrionales bacterium]|nr:rRNA pseudouridine synthase [Chitinivibrionales bacterium]
MNQRLQLNRVFSKYGVCSRSQAELLITKGRVTVNGCAVIDPHTWVSLGKDRVVLDGRPLASFQQPHAAFDENFTTIKDNLYYAFHKPRGYVTSTKSGDSSVPTIYDCLPPYLVQQWLFPVGRLDKDSEGLLLLTNDGQFSHRLTEPEFHVIKKYHVLLDHLPLQEELERLCTGIDLKDGRTKPCTIVRLHGTWFRVELGEGRNRQIRRMFWTVRCRVKRLIRTDIGPVCLGDLTAGSCRCLTRQEIKRLKKHIQNKKERSS